MTNLKNYDLSAGPMSQGCSGASINGVKTVQNAVRCSILRGAREAAAYLRISTGTFQALKNDGKIKPTYQIGESFFYDPVELIQQVQSIYGTR